MNRILVAAFFLAVGLALADDKKDLEALQGKWEMTASELDGKKQAVGQVRTVKGSAYSIEKDGKVLGMGTLKLDSSVTPRAIEITREGGKPRLGIYTIDGDVQKVCIAPEGKDRPKEFTSKGGNLLSEWKRVK